MEAVNYILGKGASIAVCISKILSTSFFLSLDCVGQCFSYLLRYLH